MVIAEDILPSRYTALKLVARGGMGEVYRATDTVLERPVAVKVLSDRYARDSEARTRFKREARAAARLSGELHVITVFDVGEHEERPFIVMEYLEGGSLHDKLSAGRIEPHEALDWLGQAADALDTAHRRGIVHRDVKPANLLLDRGGSLQVLDFGIASAAGSDALTLPGTVLGTAGYLSPEQARGEPATSASDRYALGVVAFELLTGRRPFAADTTLTEAFAHASAPIPQASAIAPTLNGDVDAVLARALAKDPSDRPSSCGELVAGLRRALAADAAPTLGGAGAPPSVRRYRLRSWRQPVLAAAAAAVAAGIAVAALALRSDSTPQHAAIPAKNVASPANNAASTTGAAPATTTPAAPRRSVQSDGASGAALNDAGFGHMQAGDYATALPLLERAVAALRGSGSLTEAYASYNLAFTRRSLGRCDGVLELLDRSAEVQGARKEIDRLRRESAGHAGVGRRDWEAKVRSGRPMERAMSSRTSSFPRTGWPVRFRSLPLARISAWLPSTTVSSPGSTRSRAVGRRTRRDRSPSGRSW